VEILKLTASRYTGALLVLAVFGVPFNTASAQLEEIVVTARKRDETQLEIPVSVSVLSQDGLDERGITTTEGLSAYTPGFDFQNLGQGGTSGRENPSIRFRGVAVQQSSPASRAGAIFWNGAYISDGAGILPLIDLQRAEVLKGPQSAVFGRNTFAGAVNLISAEPTDEVSGQGSIEITPSEDNGYSLVGAIGGPISERFGVRLAATSQNKGADYEYRDGSPLGEEETLAAQIALTFDVSDNFRLKYSGFLVESEDTRALSSQVGPVAPGDCNRTYSGSLRNVGSGQSVGTFTTDLSQSTRSLFCGTIPDWDDVPMNVPFEGVPTANSSNVFFGGGLDFVNRLPVEFEGDDMVSAPDGIGNTYSLWRNHLSAEYDFASGHNLAGFVSTGKSQHWGINDANYGTPIFFGDSWFTGFIKNVEDTSIEVRLSSPGEERLRYSIGLSNYSQESVQGNFTLFAGFDPITFIGGQSRADIDAQEGDNFGVFGTLDYDLTDAFSVSLEGRWNRDEQEITYEGKSGGAVAALGEMPVTGEVQEYSAFMPRVIFSWTPPGRGLNVYASWSKSFLQGIPTDAATYAMVFPAAGLNPATVGFFTPRQELNAIELGIKQRVGDWLNYSAAVYTMDWDNQTFFDLAPVTFTPINLSGDSEYFGVDVEFDAQLTDWLNVTGGWSYADVEFTDFAAAGSVTSAVLTDPGVLAGGTQIDATGGVPRYIPEHSGSLSARIEAGEVMGKPLYFRVDGVYTGDFFVDNLEFNQVDGFWRINVRAGVALNDNVRAELFGLNVTDDRSWISSGGTTSITGSPNRKTFGIPPRGVEWGLRIVADF
jgi:iron complex outermembrane receptor protein